MFERDHGPLEYQIAYGRAHDAPHAALPRHRHLSLRAAVLTRPGQPPGCARAPATRRPAAGPVAGRRDRRADRAAGPALRVGHVLLRAARAALRARASRASGVVDRVRASRRRHPGLLRHHGRDGARRRQPGRAVRRSPTPTSSPLDRRRPDDRGRGRSGLSGGGGLDGAELAGRAAAGRAGDRARRRRRRRPGRRSARPGCSGAAPGRRGLPVRARRADAGRGRAPTRWSSCADDADALAARCGEACDGAGRRRASTRSSARRPPRPPGCWRPAAGWSTSAAPRGDRAEFSSAVLRSRVAAVLGYTNNALTPSSGPAR